MLRRLSSPHVLIMDSQLEMLDVLGNLLHQEGYSVTLASRLLPIDAIAAIAPEVIVVEASFDGQDTGCQLIRELRADARTSAIPHICCTLFPDLANDPCLDGIPALVKPFDLEVLLQTITERYAGDRP